VAGHLLPTLHEAVQLIIAKLSDYHNCLQFNNYSILIKPPQPPPPRLWQ